MFQDTWYYDIYEPFILKISCFVSLLYVHKIYNCANLVPKLDFTIARKPVKLQFGYLHQARNAISPNGAPKAKREDFIQFKKGE